MYAHDFSIANPSVRFQGRSDQVLVRQNNFQRDAHARRMHFAGSCAVSFWISFVGVFCNMFEANMSDHADSTPIDSTWSFNPSCKSVGKIHGLHNWRILCSSPPCIGIEIWTLRASSCSKFELYMLRFPDYLPNLNSNFHSDFEIEFIGWLKSKSKY